MKRKNLVWLFSLLLAGSVCLSSCGDDDDDDDDDIIENTNGGTSNSGSTTGGNTTTTDNTVSADKIYQMWQPVSIEGYYIFDGESTKNEISATGSDAYDWLYFMQFDKSGKVLYYEGTDVQALTFDDEESFTISGTTLKLGDEVVETYKVLTLNDDNLVIEESENDGSISIDGKKCSEYYAKETYKKCTNFKASSK